MAGETTRFAGWDDGRITREKAKIRAAAFLGAVEYLAAPILVAILRGASPIDIGGYHVAIPIVVVCLIPLAYIMMKFFDGVLIMGSPRPTKARAALVTRSIITNFIGLASLLVFLHSGELRWPTIIWLLGIPAAIGLIRRIGAYQRVMERIARGERAPDA